MQQIAWLATLIGVGFILAVYLYIYLRSGDPAEFGPIKKRLYAIRPYWFVLLLIIGAWASVVTLIDGLPYAATYGEADRPPDITVSVTAYQFYWDMDQTSFVAGQDIAFEVTSNDVNHGFAIYDPEGRIVAQTQAMPGYTNILRHTFQKPGSYRIMCLEYCGLAHHNMTKELTVTGSGSGNQEAGR